MIPASEAVAFAGKVVVFFVALLFSREASRSRRATSISAKSAADDKPSWKQKRQQGGAHVKEEDQGTNETFVQYGSLAHSLH